MTTPRPWALCCTAALLLPACKDESTAPAGTPSTVTIRAYVDADGSTIYDAEDLPLEGVTVALVPAAGGSDRQATTDGEGLASFPAVPVGTYVATLEATPPAGAVLATAEAPAVVAPFQGGQVAAEFRFVFLPGTLSGVVYRDDDGDGVFEVGVDTPGAGVVVRLFAGGTVSQDTLRQATTGVDGVFSFGGLRPGTYTITLTPPVPTMTIVGDTIRTIDVPPDAVGSVSVQFQGQPILSIAQAKGVPGQVVTIQGVVTVAQGTYRTQNDNAYIQDASGGIQLFDLDPALALRLGDSVRVTGLMGSFGGEQEIVRIDAATRPTVVRLGTGSVPAPRTLTGAQIVARTYEGELARVTATLTAAPTGTTGAYNLTFRDAAATTFTVRIEAGVVASVPRSFWTANTTYAVTGALGSFNAVAQHKPRGPSDITAQ